MRAITDHLAQPQYTIALAAFAMGLGALCLYGTPFISLYFLSGRVYESVATVVSSWMGAMVGTGIESTAPKPLLQSLGKPNNTVQRRLPGGCDSIRRTIAGWKHASNWTACFADGRNSISVNQRPQQR